MKTVVLAAALAALASVQAATAAELKTVHYGIGLEQGARGTSQDQAGLGALLYVVGQRKGFFEHEGIRLEFVHYQPRPPLSNQQTLFEALAKGEFDMTRSQLPFLILDVLKGRDFAAVAGNTSNQPWTLMTRPEITDFAQLKGKTVALTLPHDLITLSMLKMMGAHGIKPADIHVTVLTGSAPRAKCVEFGECAAAALNEPFDSTLAAQGFHALGSSQDNPPISFIVEVVNKTWAQANQSTVTGYVRALAAAVRYVSDPQNADAVRPIIKEVTQGSDDSARELLTKYYYNARYPYLPRQAALDLAGIGRVLDLLGEYGQIPLPVPPASQFIDLRHAQAARHSNRAAPNCLKKQRKRTNEDRRPGRHGRGVCRLPAGRRPIATRVRYGIGLEQGGTGAAQDQSGLAPSPMSWRSAKASSSSRVFASSSCTTSRSRRWATRTRCSKRSRRASST